jgi:hypothetical protein
MKRGDGLDGANARGDGLRRAGLAGSGAGPVTMSSRLWSLGVALVALGFAAHLIGWDAILWFPMVAIDSLMWLPMAVIDGVRESPGTYGVVALGVALMVLARVIGRRKG